MVYLLKRAQTVAQYHWPVMLLGALMLGSIAWGISLALGAAAGLVSDTIANFIAGLALLALELLLVIGVAGAALGVDTYDESDVYQGSGAPFGPPSFDEAVGFCSWLFGALTGNRKRFVLLFRPKVVGLALVPLAPTVLLAASTSGIQFKILGALAVAIFSVYAVSALADDDDSWGLQGASTVAAERTVESIAVVAIGTGIVTLASVIFASFPLGTLLVWCIGMVAITSLSVGLVEVTRGEVLTPRPGRKKRERKNLDGEVISAPSIVYVHVGGATLTGSATPNETWGEWINCEAPGKLTIEVVWNDGYPAQVHVSDANGEWFPATPMHESGTQEFDVQPGWHWVQVAGDSRVPSRPVQVSWKLARPTVPGGTSAPPAPPAPEADAAA
jgi:hypothetical protein